MAANFMKRVFLQDSGTLFAISHVVIKINLYICAFSRIKSVRLSVPKLDMLPLNYFPAL
jgi:hypothetical protein